LIYIEGLEWDEENERHISRHSVLPTEVEEAVEGRLHAYKHKGRLVILGRSEVGRYLLVVLEHQRRGFWRPVTARDMDPKERRLLQRVLTKKGVK